MDWRGPSAASLLAAIILFGGFWMEPVFPLGDDRWLVLAVICAAGIVVITPRQSGGSCKVVAKPHKIR